MNWEFSSLPTRLRTVFFCFFAIRLGFWSFYFSYPSRCPDGCLTEVTSESYMVKLWRINADVISCAVFAVAPKWRNPTVWYATDKPCCGCKRIEPKLFSSRLVLTLERAQEVETQHAPFSPPLPPTPTVYVSALYFSVPYPPSSLSVSSLWLADEAPGRLPHPPSFQKNLRHTPQSPNCIIIAFISVIVHCGTSVECSGFKEEITSSVILSVCHLWMVE